MRRFYLIRMVVRDFIVDYRNSTDDAEKALLRADIGVLFRARHVTQLDRYGWPVVLGNNQPTPQFDAAFANIFGAPA